MLSISNLVLDVSQRSIVNGISFDAKTGDIIGLMGVNGAGKTTTMRMIAGALEPTNGTIIIDNIDIWKSREEAQRHLGYLPEGAPLYGEMTPKSYLQFVCGARSLPKESHDALIRDAAIKTNIKEVFHQRIDTLSKGYKRRVAFAGAIVHCPKVLILDEPTDGLDPNQRKMAHDLVLGVAAHSITLISTHSFEEINEICNRVLIIDYGEIIQDISKQDLQKLAKNNGLESLFCELTSPEPILSKEA